MVVDSYMHITFQKSVNLHKNSSRYDNDLEPFFTSNVARVFCKASDFISSLNLY